MLVGLAGEVVPIGGPVPVGVVEDEVGLVGVPAAGHRDVERLPGGRGVGQHVRGVHGHALGAVRGGRVAEFDVLADVRRRAG